MDFSTIYNLILTTAIGVITFFLKRSFDKLDSRASKVDVENLKRKTEHLETNFVRESRFEDLREKVEKADEKYASKAELNDLKASIDKINDKIDEIKNNTLRTEEFLRVTNKLESKIDDLMRRG